ncbi:unnamed protein product [Tetraodon nigroviridis]|uniref:(spotted green pufferfish) hypothetical protein n=1 Tax=Tetraodon nigroviridis TaxID=99883 RepID=Q4RJ49_TETNG|nr:unnamed protein product [Tetraodon nigroviridis]
MAAVSVATAMDGGREGPIADRGHQFHRGDSFSITLELQRKPGCGKFLTFKQKGDGVLKNTSTGSRSELLFRPHDLDPTTVGLGGLAECSRRRSPSPVDVHGLQRLGVDSDGSAGGQGFQPEPQGSIPGMVD